MGFAKLNIWVRNTNCEIVTRTGHLHVYNCHGTQVLPTTWFQNGHVEVEVPPGCYIVQAGVVWGNIYTDRAMVLARCGDHVCVNLVLADFAAHNPPPLERQPQQLYYCPAANLTAFAANAARADIPVEDFNQAVGVLAKAAGVGQREFLRTARADADLLRKNIDRFRDEEKGELEEYLARLNRILSGKGE